MRRLVGILYAQLAHTREAQWCSGMTQAYKFLCSPRGAHQLFAMRLPRKCGAQEAERFACAGGAFEQRILSLQVSTHQPESACRNRVIRVDELQSFPTLLR